MGLLDEAYAKLAAYKQANTPRNTRPAVNPAQVMDQGLLGGAVSRIPANAQAMYQGLLAAPDELSALASPNMAQQVNQAMSRNVAPDKQQWMDAGLELSGMAPVMGLAGHIAYHGSPHKFDKFDMSKIGTGEGAQAYGHGLYFAENPAVAKSYQEQLSGSEFRLKGGGEYDPSNPLHMAAAELEDAKNAGIDKIQLAKNLYEKEKSLRSRNTEWSSIAADDVNKTWQSLFSDNLPELETIQHGSMYKVDIPDESIPHMLDWDKPLSEQHPDVQAIASKRMDELRAMGGSLPQDPSGEWLHRAFQPQAGEQGFGQAIGANRMRDAGIPGIRYLDGNSRGAGGTSNFVLFDDQLPRILETNGQPSGLLSYADEAAQKAKKK